MRVTVAAPPPRVPAAGLIASLGGEDAIRAYMAANPPEQGGDPDRWEAGFTFLPYSCASTSGAYDISCGVASGLNQNTGTVPSAVTFDPIGLYDTVQCSTLTGMGTELEDRAKAKLLRTTSKHLEAEFWKGTIAKAATLGNGYLTKSADVTTLNGGTALKVLDALALLQQYLAEALSGATGMIHCDVRTAGLWYSANQAIRRDGDVLVDAFNNVVVAGSGYTGSNPGDTADGGPASTPASAAWAYATSPVDVRLSEIQTKYFADPINNNEFYLATRAAAVTWDHCVLAGVKIDRTPT